MEREKRTEDVDLDAIQAEMKESEEIDRRVEALMAPEEDGGNGKKKKKRKKNKGENGYSEKQGLIKRIKGWEPQTQDHYSSGYCDRSRVHKFPVWGKQQEHGDDGGCPSFVKAVHTGKAVLKRPGVRDGQRGCCIQYPCRDHGHECKGGRPGP